MNYNDNDPTIPRPPFAQAILADGATAGHYQLLDLQTDKVDST
jgi:hypothetical protein